MIDKLLALEFGLEQGISRPDGLAVVCSRDDMVLNQGSKKDHVAAVKVVGAVSDQALKCG